MTQIGFYYNQKMCSGCKTCQVACKDKNRLNAGTVLREVRSYATGTYPNVNMYFYSATCNHCEAPACAEKCPVGAYEKLEDGTVVQDPKKCIGCGTCIKACPYGVPREDVETGCTRKCDGCIELREAGYQPACVEACPYRALDFGDVEELRKKYGTDLVTALPAQGEGDTGPNTLINPRKIALDDVGVAIML